MMYRWKALLLSCSEFERPWLHNGSLIGQLPPSESIYVYFTFCKPGLSYFVVNYVTDAKNEKPSFFLEKMLAQTRDEPIPLNAKLRKQVII